MKLKDLLKVVDDNVSVMIFSSQGYCGKYVKQDYHSCYFNDWYISDITTDNCYSEPTIVIEIQEGEVKDE